MYSVSDRGSDWQSVWLTVCLSDHLTNLREQCEQTEKQCWLTGLVTFDCTIIQNHTMHWVGCEIKRCAFDLVSVGWRLCALCSNPLKELGWALQLTGLHLETAACLKNTELLAWLPAKMSLFSHCVYISVKLKMQSHFYVSGNRGYTWDSQV